VLVRFFRTSFATQYITTGLFALAAWGAVLPHPPPMPEPSGPVILYSLLFQYLSATPVLASLSGLVVVVISALWLNLLLTRHEIVPKSSSLVSFLFILLMCSHPDQMTLTPVNISVLLFLPLLKALLEAYNRQDPVDLTFSAGFIISFSALFYLPSFLYYGFLLTAFLVYRSVKWREWAGSFIGLITPALFLAAWWFWTDRLPEMAAQYAACFSKMTFSNPWQTADKLIPAIFILVFVLAGMSYNFNHLSERTVETRKKLILLSWLMIWTAATFPFAGSLLFIHPELAFPALAPFLSNVYLSRKKPFRWELLLWAFIFTIAANLALNLMN
jgi:hypothetical protein